MKTYFINGAVAVVAVYVALMLPVVGPMLKTEMQKPA